MAFGNTETLVWKLEAQDNASTAFRRVGSSVDATGSKFKRLGTVIKAVSLMAAAAIAAMAAAAGYALFNLAKQSITSASDLNESVNAVRVTWGKAADDILKQSKKAADGLGLSQSAFNALSVQFSSFSQTIAGKGGDAAEVFGDLAGRGADFASVMNLEVNEAMRLFQSGLAGETEPLRKFGIDLSAAAVGAYAVKKGIAQSAATMTEAQKVQARYQLLMKQTSKTQGDFKNTSGDLANAQRILTAKWEDAKAKIGKALLPMLGKLVKFLGDQVVPMIQNKVVPWVRAAARWLGENLPKAAKAISDWWNQEGKDKFDQLWGSLQDLWGSTKKLVKQVLDLVSGWESVSDGEGGWTESLSAITDGVDDAAAALKPVVDLLSAAVGFLNWIEEHAAGVAQAFKSALNPIEAAKFLYNSRPGQAKGGYLERAMGGWTMVGEHGPELINNAGYVKTASQTRGMQGGGGIHITINGAIDPVSTARQIERILAKGGRVTGRGGLATA